MGSQLGSSRRIDEKAMGRLRNHLLDERCSVLVTLDMVKPDMKGVESVCSDILRQIDEALERMDEGAYGRCEVCGDPIPAARLRALPYATACVACKLKEEMAAPCVSAWRSPEGSGAPPPSR